MNTGGSASNTSDTTTATGTDTSTGTTTGVGAGAGTSPPSPDQFASKRAAHYNEFKLIQGRWRWPPLVRPIIWTLTITNSNSYQLPNSHPQLPSFSYIQLLQAMRAKQQLMDEEEEEDEEDDG